MFLTSCSSSAIFYDSFHSTELANKFLKLPNHHNRVVVTRKRVNRDIGLGLEIPVDYSFHGDNRVIEWFKKFIEKFDKFTDVKVEECMKNLRNLFIH